MMNLTMKIDCCVEMNPSTSFQFNEKKLVLSDNIIANYMLKF